MACRTNAFWSGVSSTSIVFRVWNAAGDVKFFAAAGAPAGLTASFPSSH